MSYIRRFIEWLGNALTRASHARYGVVSSPIVLKKPVVDLQIVFDELWPGSSIDAREELLWMTPYPFINVEGVAFSLCAIRTKWGPKIGDAINGEMSELNRIWKETRPHIVAWENEGGSFK